MSDKKVLKFNKWFYQPINEGEKCTTIRTKHKDICEGDKVVFKFTDGKKVIAQILAVRRVRFGNLKPNDAFHEGYRHVDFLKKELTEIYGEFGDDDVLYVFEFRIISDIISDLI